MPNRPKFPLPEQECVNSIAKHIGGASLVLEVGDQVVIVKDHIKSYWTFPGGVVEQDETPLAGAVRETKEEIGLEIDPSRLEFQFVAVSNKLNYKAHHFIFMARVDAAEIAQIKLGVNEIDQYQLISKAEILAAPKNTMSWAVMAWARGETGYIDFTHLVEIK